MGACTNRSCGKAGTIKENLPEYVPFVVPVSEPHPERKLTINSRTIKKYNVRQSFESLCIQGHGVEIIIKSGHAIKEL